MVVRLPEIKLSVPSRSTVWSWLSKGVIAACLIAALVGLADWRLNSRLDRSGLERLAADTATVPATGNTAARQRKR